MMIWSRKQERGLLDKIPEPNVKEKRRRRWNRKPHPRGQERACEIPATTQPKWTKEIIKKEEELLDVFYMSYIFYSKQI